jgi:hypothetical protein
MSHLSLFVVEGSHDVVITVDEDLTLTSEHDLGTSVLGEEDGIAFLDEGSAERSVLEGLAGSNRDNGSEVKLLFGSGGEDDSTLGLGDDIGLLDNDSVEEGTESSEC